MDMLIDEVGRCFSAELCFSGGLADVLSAVGSEASPKSANGTSRSSSSRQWPDESNHRNECWLRDNAMAGTHFVLE